MKKLLILSLMAAVASLSACGKTEPPKPGVAASAKKAVNAEGPAPEAAKSAVVAPKPPPPPGGGQPAPELKPEDIARIQKMLKDKAAESAAQAGAAAASKK